MREPIDPMTEKKNVNFPKFTKTHSHLQTFRLIVFRQNIFIVAFGSFDLNEAARRMTDPGRQNFRMQHRVDRRTFSVARSEKQKSVLQ